VSVTPLDNINYECGNNAANPGGGGSTVFGSGADGGDTDFGSYLTAQGGLGGNSTTDINGGFSLDGGGGGTGSAAGNDGRRFPSLMSGVPGAGGASGASGGGGGGAPCGLPFAIDTTLLGDGGDGGTHPSTPGSNATGNGAGGGGGTNSYDGGDGSPGVIFVIPVS